MLLTEKKVLSFEQYFLKELRVILCTLIVLGITGNLLDLTLFSQYALQNSINNLIVIMILLLSGVLHFAFRLNVRYAAVMGLYALVSNIIYSQFVSIGEPSQDVWFFRESFFYSLLLCTAVIFTGRIHGIILGAMYIIFAAILSIYDDVGFIRANLPITLVMVISFSVVITFIVHKLRIDTTDLQKKNNIISEQNDRLEEQFVEISAMSETVREANLNLEDHNRKLQDLNRIKDLFLSILAHDLRGPVFAIRLAIDNMISSFERVEKEKQLERLKLVASSMDNLTELLENLLLWGRSQTGMLTVDPQIFPIGKVLRKSLESIVMQAAHKRILLDHSFREDLTLKCDPMMFETIIRNLLSNAIKFTPEEGRITITATSSDESIVISVSDTGIGMSSEKIAALYDIGIRQTGTGTEGEKGSGLGLIICRDFVNRNAGTIDVESEAGKGTRFTVSFPSR
jgi:signal transduction histidine kinase